MVAGYASREFVARGVEPGALSIISADSAPPYERPPLSKGLLAGREQLPDILINDEGFYRDHGIELRLDTRVKLVDFGQRCLLTERGERIDYEKLLIATGARPRQLDVPGADLDGVMLLRTVADALAIRAQVEGARRAVTVGAGFISLEVASVFASSGVETAMIFPEARVWERLFTPEMSAFFERYYAERGVRIVANESLQRFEGNLALRRAVGSGGTAVDADIAVVGVGIEPVVDILADGGIRVDKGSIIVNEYLETGVPDVYAAGDVVRYRDLLFGNHRRADHWDNAVEQGKHVARVMTGERVPFVHVPYFFSDVFDLSYEYWGDPSIATSVVYRGDVAGGSFSAWWQRHETVVGAFVMNRPDEEREVAPQWISERMQIAPEQLERAPSLRDLRV